MQDYSAELYQLLQRLNALKTIRGDGFDPATDTLEKLRDELTAIEGSGFATASHSLAKLAGSAFDPATDSLQQIRDNMPASAPLSNIYSSSNYNQTANTTINVTGAGILLSLGGGIVSSSVAMSTWSTLKASIYKDDDTNYTDVYVAIQHNPGNNYYFLNSVKSVPLMLSFSTRLKIVFTFVASNTSYDYYAVYTLN